VCVCVCVFVGGRPTDELRGSSTLSGLVLCSLGVQGSAARAPTALCVHLAVICQSAPGHDFVYTSQSALHLELVPVVTGALLVSKTEATGRL